MGRLKKWIFAGLGWAVGGPIGALFGFFLGKALSDQAPRLYGSFGDRTNPYGGSQPFQGPYRNTGTRNDFDIALLVLIAAVMKADGDIKKSELDCVKQFLLKNYSEEEAKELLLMLRDLTKKEIDLDGVCRQIKVNTDYTTRYHMLDFLFTLAGSDSFVDNYELNVLNRIRSAFGINYSDYISILARHGQSYSGSQSKQSNSGSSWGKDPYKVLGLESTASDDEVRKAYRRLAMKYHPDKVEGMGDEVKRNAEAQFREINEAYETIKNARGMK